MLVKLNWYYLCPLPFWKMTYTPVTVTWLKECKVSVTKEPNLQKKSEGHDLYSFEYVYKLACILIFQMNSVTYFMSTMQKLRQSFECYISLKLFHCVHRNIVYMSQGYSLSRWKLNSKFNQNLFEVYQILVSFL